MKFENLSKYFEYSTRCAVCKNAMPLYCTQRSNSEIVTFKIDGQKCELLLLRKIAGGITLLTNENKYFPSNRPSNDLLLLSKAVNFKQIIFVRRCHMCNSNYEISTAPLHFTDEETFSPVKIATIKFNVSEINSNNDWVKVTNNLENKQTYLVRGYFEGNAYLAKHTTPVIVPLVNFNFDDHQKLVNKIRTLLTLS